jgi:hypothetical protein
VAPPSAPGLCPDHSVVLELVATPTKDPASTVLRTTHGAITRTIAATTAASLPSSARHGSSGYHAASAITGSTKPSPLVSAATPATAPSATAVHHRRAGR